MAKTICRIQQTQKKETEKKNDDRARKALYKIMNSAVYGKTMI